MLDEEVERIIVETVRGIEGWYDIEFEQIGCGRDHIHILCAAHPEVAPGRTVRVFKSPTAREIFRAKPCLKSVLRDGQFWTSGSYVATVGEKGEGSAVERYVKNQVNREKSYVNSRF